jgi:uncharacterized membrane protein YgdD (TMEM256/DUF423 family)
VGAHLSTGDNAAELLHTAADYGLPHAAALVGLSALTHGRAAPGFALITAGWAFALGGLLFSLSLVALGSTGIRAFGVVTPFGGVALLIGWAALGAGALRFGFTKGQASRASATLGRDGGSPG